MKRINETNLERAVRLRDARTIKRKAFLAKLDAAGTKKEIRYSKDQAMKDLGLVKVRGSLGGVYYE